MSNQYPFEWVDMTPEQKKTREKLFPSDLSTMKHCVISKPGNVWMPRRFTLDVAKSIYEFPIRPDDIWINTYPKCGTTWTQELVWQVMNDCQFEKAKEVSLYFRSPFLEMQGLLEDTFQIVEDDPETKKFLDKVFFHSVDYAKDIDSPRIIKSHLPLDMLPPKTLDSSKVIYVARNPKDACVSYYHHAKLFSEGYAFEGTFQDFANLFLEGTFEYGDYWHHLKTAWNYKNHPNMKIVWFEDMKKDLAKVIREIAEFVGKQMTDEKIGLLVDHLKIENSRKIATENAQGNVDYATKMSQFFRKGQVGDWKNFFAENDEKWENWVQTNIEGTDIQIKYELK